ncbi:hypothetical protein BGW80DRAFT_1565476 [Lactifluus volemus]|nr:hypothetical protein BGW80DRAFT_1565476 [Lactifluus volemus]
MPKKRLFNLENLGNWASIKKKKKNNGNTEVVAGDKEQTHPDGVLANKAHQTCPSSSFEIIREPIPDYIRSVLQQPLAGNSLSLSDGEVPQMPENTTKDSPEVAENEVWVWEDEESRHLENRPIGDSDDEPDAEELLRFQVGPLYEVYVRL